MLYLIVLLFCYHYILFINYIIVYYNNIMIRQITKQYQLNRLFKKNSAFFAQDWSHVYDGIYRFEDNTLG